MLKIVVCVKAVPDPKEAHKIKIDPVTKTLMRLDVPLALNLLDKNAMEAALQLKEQLDAHITVVSMGPSAAGNVVKDFPIDLLVAPMPMPRRIPLPKV
jgi:electron transfer flavoprotein beta subunit